MAAAGLSAAATAPASAAPAVCGTPQEVTLWAEQTKDAGTVTISNDKDNLYVDFDITAPWAMTESHVAVADTLAGIPMTNKGMPKIGNFGLQRSYAPPASSETYVIPRPDLSLDPNQEVVVAAHATLVSLNSDGSVAARETGWADGSWFVDRGSWATYVSYIRQDCVVDPPVETATQTAFAKDVTGGSATCFLDLDLNDDGKGDFNRWGWTNGELVEGDYEFELYAGAGQCDVRKGTDVGRVNVSYHDGSATVTFTAEGKNGSTGVAYSMEDAHAYIGSAILPSNNGDYTVAPGQYPQIDSELKGATGKSFTFTGLSGPIYFVAHTSVAGFPAA